MHRDTVTVGGGSVKKVNNNKKAANEWWVGMAYGGLRDPGGMRDVSRGSGGVLDADGNAARRVTADHVCPSTAANNGFLWLIYYHPTIHHFIFYGTSKASFC